MSDSDEDLEALFEEMALQSLATREQTVSDEKSVTAPTPAPEPQKIAPVGSTSGNQGTLTPIIDDLFPESNSTKPMYDRLGGVVRLLHDSMRELGYDRSLSHATSQITDAHDRLAHIATLTEEAANKVLNATDEGMPEQDVLAKSAKGIDSRWNSLFAGQMTIDDFKILAKDSQQFSKQAIASTESEKARLLEIMMAQDFQDLTGQLIKKVITITSAVERELAQILIDNAPASFKEKPVELMEGPSSPASALEQDDVDSLLDSLGF